MPTVRSSIGEVIPIERTVPIVERGEILDDDTIAKILDTEVKTLLRAIGYNSDKDIIDIFGLADEVPATEEVLRENAGRRLAARSFRLNVRSPSSSVERSSTTIPLPRFWTLKSRRSCCRRMRSAPRSTPSSTTPCRRTRPIPKSRLSISSTSSSATRNRRMRRRPVT